MTRAYRDASEPEGSMTNPSEAQIEAGMEVYRNQRPGSINLSAIYAAMRQAAPGGEELCSVLADCSEFLAGDAFDASGYPEAKELADRCDRLLQKAATPAAPVQDDDAELVIDWLKQHDDASCGGTMYGKAAQIIARLTPDRVTPLVEALRSIANSACGGGCGERATSTLRDGGFDDA